ncbi:PREDICTED: uncharacterized protein LOC105116220 [Populus euphratica]|uniref:Uncharacterized protein LOC105116220 n=1 Tax=Populus euphratica TaxID=75702 RepID=A0AAJ6TJ78_POPEU|nr:PREDICTED: uncharacterized protein LOC105116220 [Populus euphratica]XP_011011757.1 PREDICTED: uncharacterized protein LOC105116220 [Populus euphratica]
MKALKMSSDVKSSRGYSKPSSERGFSLDLKKSSRWQKHSRIVKDTALPTHARQSLKHQDKLKAEYYDSQPCGDVPHELRLHANDRISVQPKTSGKHHQLHSDRIKARKDDELVKYMSDLPGYLQRMQRSESIQDKALNVGVLDWSRLKKWRIAASDHSSGASLTSSNFPSKMAMNSATSPHAVYNNILNYRSKKHPSLSSSLNPSHNDRVSQPAKPSVQNALPFKDFETASKSSVDGKKKVPRTNRTFSRNSSDVILEQAKREYVDQKITSKVGSWSSNSRYDSISIWSKVNAIACDSAAEKRAGERRGPDAKRKSLDHKITSSIGASSSQLRSHYDSLSLKEKNVAGGKTKGIELQESTVDLSPQHQPIENKNIVLVPKNYSTNFSLQEPRTPVDKDIVLLVPKHFSTYCSLQELRTPVDKDFSEINQKSLSDDFSHEEVRSSEIPHSCPLLSRNKTNTQLYEVLHTAMVTQSAKMSSDASRASACSYKMPIRLSEDKFAEESRVRTANGRVVETSNALDQEKVELMPRKVRHPSPNRWFSFSLSRISRSFSFKETSAVPQFSSTYISINSGPLISEVSACLNNSNRKKAGSHNRARSSPLRRMLDPLLKSWSSRILQSAETGSSNESLNFFNLKQFDAKELLKDGKHGPSRIKALLQLTIRNGVPLFRFVIENNSNILEASMNKLSSSQENGSGCNYTFYAIDEIKKKSGSWINQGSKEKSCGYVYNLIGHMKVNCSSIFDLTGTDSICQIKVKESVLFGVDQSQADQALPKVMANREIAAVVVKMPSEISSLDLQLTDQNENLKHEGSSQYLPESQCSGNLGETEHSISATVILPGGNHSMPNEGVPSPLLHRWRSGGSCDCGGWDVGCKLRILTNRSQCSKITRTSKSCLMSDCFELFTQGAIQQDHPIFSLAQVEKGMYSTEFSSSISSLEAFFICVNVISCRKSYDQDGGNASSEEFHQELSNSSNGSKKIHTISPGQTNVKYTLSPPVSPFERM